MTDYADDLASLRNDPMTDVPQKLSCSKCGRVTCFDEGGSQACEYATSVIAERDEAIKALDDLLNHLTEHPSEWRPVKYEKLIEAAEQCVNRQHDKE